MGHRVSPIHHSESSLTRLRSEEREDQALRRGQKIEVRERERGLTGVKVMETQSLNLTRFSRNT